MRGLQVELLHGNGQVYNGSAPPSIVVVESSRSRFGKMVKFCCDVTCVLAEGKFRAVSGNCEDGVVVSSSAAPSVRTGRVFDKLAAGS